MCKAYTHRKSGVWPKGTDVFEYKYLDIDRKEFVTKDCLQERYPEKADFFLRVDHKSLDQVIFAMSKNYFDRNGAINLCRSLSANTPFSEDL